MPFKTPESRLAYLKQYRDANKDRLKAERTRNKAKTLDTRRKRLYGIGTAAFEQLLESQGGKCACCGTSSPAVSGWHVDHCHASGEVRGILCFHCNTGIGHFRDDPARLRAAADYLEAANATCV